MRCELINNCTHTLSGKLSILTAKEDKYDGQYIVTPNRTTQTLPTKGKSMLNDVEVRPIPPEFGYVEWDGSVLTIS